MELEKTIKDYLKNRHTYQKIVREDISFIHEEISHYDAVCNNELKDIVLSGKHLIKPSKTNNVYDQTAMAYFRYQESTKHYLEMQNEILNAKLDHLDYLNDLKCFYDSIDLEIIKLAPRNKISIEIYVNGGKIEQIAKELDCSYNTARIILNASIKSIINGIDEKLLKSVTTSKYHRACI